MLRKRWRKRGSKDWEGGERGRSSRGGKDDEQVVEKRRASACVTAEELRAKAEQKNKEDDPESEEEPEEVKSSNLAEEDPQNKEPQTNLSPPILQNKQNQDKDMPRELEEPDSSQKEREQNNSRLDEDINCNIQEQDDLIIKTCEPEDEETRTLRVQNKDNEILNRPEEGPIIYTEEEEQADETQIKLLKNEEVMKDNPETQRTQEPEEEHEPGIERSKYKEMPIKQTNNDTEERQENQTTKTDTSRTQEQEEQLVMESHELEEIQINQVSEETEVSTTQKPEDKNEAGTECSEYKEVQMEQIWLHDQESKTDKTETESCEHEEIQTNKISNENIASGTEEPEDGPEIESHEDEKEIEENRDDHEAKTDNSKTQELETSKPEMQIDNQTDEKQDDQETSNVEERTKEPEDEPEIKHKVINTQDQEEDLNDSKEQNKHPTLFIETKVGSEIPSTENVITQEVTQHIKDTQNIPEMKEEMVRQEQVHLPGALKVEVHETPTKTDKEVLEKKPEEPHKGDEDQSRLVPEPETVQPGKSEIKRAEQLDEKFTTVSDPEVQPGGSISDPVIPKSPEPQAADTKKEKDDSTSNAHPPLRLRRSSSSQNHPTILSEETFKMPQQMPSWRASTDSDCEPEPIKAQQTQTQPLPAHNYKAEKPGWLFHFFPTKSIPKIVIQDENGEKLSSKEKRRRRREQERKKKEEEKDKRQQEKKKIQTRGRSFQLLRRKHEDSDSSGRSSPGPVSKRNSEPFSESYFWSAVWFHPALSTDMGADVGVPPPRLGLPNPQQLFLIVVLMCVLMVANVCIIEIVNKCTVTTDSIHFIIITHTHTYIHNEHYHKGA